MEFRRIFSSAFSNLHRGMDDSFGFVGYAGGKPPAACAAAFPVCGTMYIALVSTVPEAHDKGYAEAVMRRDPAGWRSDRPARMTLHASDMGRPVYRAMGFEAGARVMLLAPADARPAGH